LVQLSRKVGIGVIGCGVIGKAGHLRRYKNNEHCEVIAVADVIEGRAKEVAEKFGVKHWYTDYHELVDHEEIEGVSIATPHPVHAEPSIAAANAGKHILCEKPMCTTLKDANAMVEAARKNRVKLFVGYQTRFMPSMIRMRTLLDESVIGRVHEMCRIGGALQERSDADWFYSKWAGGGVTLDWTTYTLYMLRYLMGKTKSVYALADINAPFKYSTDKPGTMVKMEVEDTISMLMRFENGAAGFVYDSWSSCTVHGYIEVVGTDGLLTLEDPWTSKTINLYTKKVTVPEYVSGRHLVNVEPPSGFDAYQARVDHFVECVLNDKEPAIPGDVGRDVIEVTEAAYRSVRENKPIQLPIQP